jgi:hypothetical protein
MPTTFSIEQWMSTFQGYFVFAFQTKNKFHPDSCPGECADSVNGEYWWFLAFVDAVTTAARYKQAPFKFNHRQNLRGFHQINYLGHAASTLAHGIVHDGEWVFNDIPFSLNTFRSLCQDILSDCFTDENLSKVKAKKRRFMSGCLKALLRAYNIPQHLGDSKNENQVLEGLVKSLDYSGITMKIILSDAVQGVLQIYENLDKSSSPYRKMIQVVDRFELGRATFPVQKRKKRRYGESVGSSISQIDIFDFNAESLDRLLPDFPTTESRGKRAKYFDPHCDDDSFNDMLVNFQLQDVFNKESMFVSADANGTLLHPASCPV